MAENSGIGWTTNTFNPWQGCNKVSGECTHCYINALMRWQGKEPFNGPIRTKDWSKPLRWNRKAALTGERPRIFTCSMSDFFHPGADQWRDEAWDIIRATENLDWLILTKRPELIPDRLPSDWGDGYGNVWLGVTCGVQSSLHRIPLIQKIPAKVRFISAEPLLEQIDFTPYLDGSIDWIITGCEKAAKNKRRPMNLDWVRDIDLQCRNADVAHFFKQRYDGTQIVTDGLLDGFVRHSWPKLKLQYEGDTK
jgi:protein gp37